jgi:signal peptide peptidase SppA
MRFDATEPHAILPEAVAGLLEQLTGKVTSVKSSLPEPYCLASEGGEPIEWSAVSSGGGSSGMLAVIPLSGPLSPDGRYGGTSLNGFTRAIAMADANPNIGYILIHITSPGGTVTGTPEAGEAVRAVRDGGRTRIVAIADGMMASAATWIGTAAEEVVVTPSGEAGSIGVISMYADQSKLLESIGLSVEVIRNPAKKARFTGIEPMTEDMRQTMETRNASAYERFKRAIADNRKVRVDTVEAKFGGGEMMDATEAKAAGLVDRIDTLDATISRMLKRPARKAPSSALAALALTTLDE